VADLSHTAPWRCFMETGGCPCHLVSTQ
jgi:hypothetical protein